MHGGVTREAIAPPVPCAGRNVGGVTRGLPPPVKVRGSDPKKKFGPYFLVGGPAHGFVHGFAHGFGA